MAKYKITSPIRMNGITVFSVNDIVEGSEPKPVKGDKHGTKTVSVALSKAMVKKLNGIDRVSFKIGSSVSRFNQAIALSGIVGEPPRKAPEVTATPEVKVEEKVSLETQVNASPLGKTARNIQIGVAVIGWGIFGFVAYKYWNKSKYWKAGVVGLGLFNAYNTYKIFSKPAIQVGGDAASKASTGVPTGEEVFAKIMSMGGTASAEKKAAFVAAFNGLSDQEKSAASDTMDIQVDCMKSTGGDAGKAFVCMATKGQELSKKYPEEVIKSANAKLSAAAGKA